ncbi:MAG: hypothetical protein DPW16_02190 [Chloroflexi bacterium]|nr:hypothetical protein [Chloroflexota bacterium]
MGYDAFVRCNCWKEGKTKPYPFDFTFHFDAEGFPQIDLPEPSIETEQEEYWQKENELERWLEDCCEHPRMRVADVRLANITDMIAFKQTLSSIGWENFPVLEEELPVANGGSVSSKVAAQMFLEVISIIKREILGQSIFLIDSDTDRIVQVYFAQRDGIFWHLPKSGVDIGFDELGFFIAERHQYNDPVLDITNQNYNVQEPRHDLFRAVRLEIEQKENTTLRFENLDSHTAYACEIGLGGGYLTYRGQTIHEVFKKGQEKRRLHVETRTITHEDFRETLQALIWLCRASMDTGNPIYWC